MRTNTEQEIRRACRPRHVNRSAALALVAALGVSPFLATGTAAAQEEEKTVYTRVALWQVDRTRTSDFVAFFEKYDKPIMERLFADGMISEWGIDATALHKPDGYTHSTWYSAPSMSALAKAGEAYMAAWEKVGGDNMKALDTEFESMVTKHRDYLLETEGMRSTGATIEGGYFHASYVVVTRDRHRQFHSFWNNRMKPVYEKLLKDGAIVAYGLTTEGVVTEEPMGHNWWYVTANADGLDKVDAAFDAWWDELDEEGRRERWVSIMDTVEEDSFREWMTYINHMAIKAQ